MVDLITEHIATWAAAQIPKINGGRGRGRGSNGQSPHGIKKLRGLILELAVRGKLVPQDPNDEPASVLLGKIAKEKARLIKEGKIKKQKKLPEINEDKKPFELPEGWEFERFGNITINRDAERIPLSVEERRGRQGEYDYYGASGVIDSINDYLFDKPLLLIGEDGANLINRSTPIAFMARGKYWVNNHAHVLDGLTEELLLYICLHINAISLEPFVTGTAQPKMNQAKMNTILMALPPLTEQHRIVTKVDELMALCDKLEQQQTDSNATHQTLVKTLLATLTTIADQAEFAEAWQRIANHFDTLFATEQSIDQLKQTILQLAVMGKLVPQYPNDEPASVLLEKIAKEKARLIKEGRIKKQKPLPKISEDEKPFELPKGWEWARFGVLVNSILSGGTPSKRNPEYWNGDIPWASVKDLGKTKYLEETQDHITPKGLRAGSKLAEINDVIICTRMGLGKIAIAKARIAINQDLKVIKLTSQLDVDFFLNFFATLNIKGTGTTVAGIRQEKLLSYVLCLPPLAEQHRIVTKVDELMALCDALKESLHDAQTTQIQLADTIVEQAVA